MLCAQVTSELQRGLERAAVQRRGRRARAASAGPRPARRPRSRWPAADARPPQCRVDGPGRGGCLGAWRDRSYSRGEVRPGAVHVHPHARPAAGPACRATRPASSLRDRLDLARLRLPRACGRCERDRRVLANSRRSSASAAERPPVVPAEHDAGADDAAAPLERHPITPRRCRDSGHMAAGTSSYGEPDGAGDTAPSSLGEREDRPDGRPRRCRLPCGRCRASSTLQIDPASHRAAVHRRISVEQRAQRELKQDVKVRGSTR